MNLNVNKTAKAFFDKYFWRQHPEAALRYSPVVAAIYNAHLEESKILEVGSGSLGITPYFKREIDGVDIDFSGPKSPFLKQIKATAMRMPFKKNSYDVVISVDTLEHIKKEDREEAIFEIVKIAKRMAVIVVPVGALSEEQDMRLANRWSQIFKNRNQFLEEHVENGLPKTDEILTSIDQSLRKLSKTGKITSSPNLNLYIRSILMKSWISKSKFLYAFYMKGFLLLLPLLKLANFGACYRRVIVLEFPQVIDKTS